MRIYEFQEETDYKVPEAEFGADAAWALYQSHSKLIEVGFPTRLTNNHYIFRSKGYVGQIPLSDGSIMRIHPKVPIQNVFRMLEYAYKLKSFRFLEGMVSVSTLDEVFERLASVLAKRVLDRAHKGLYQDYVTTREPLPYLRGRIAVNESLQMALRGSATLSCCYEELTTDLEDNRILAWTLYQLPKFQLHRQDVRHQIRQAYRVLAGTVETSRIEAGTCVKRFYHRLNEDYQVLHAICRFFLEHCGPVLQAGEHKLLPFIVNMPNLFESFISEWLKASLPDRFRIEPQYTANLNESGSLYFKIDLVLYDNSSNKVIAVMDTKYKKASQPEESDISQIVSYALKMETKNAFLVYPAALASPLDVTIGNIRLRNLTFDLGDSLDVAGNSVLMNLGTILS